MKRKTYKYPNLFSLIINSLGFKTVFTARYELNLYMLYNVDKESLQGVDATSKLTIWAAFKTIYYHLNKNSLVK